MARRMPMAEFLAEHGDDTYVVDVREAAEYAEGHVPGAVLAPMSQIWAHLADLPRDRTVHVICRSGNRSQSMTDLMVAQGIDAVSIDDGTLGWIAGGRPVGSGRAAA